jgi:hypothetical protein
MLKTEHAKNHGKRNYSLFLLCSLTVVVVIATILAVSGNSMQEPTKEHLSVDDPRPVALAAEMLEQKYGWIITYEDPRYAHESDLVDVTQQVRRDLDKYKPGQAPKVFIPKGGPLELDYDIDPVTKRPAAADVTIQQLLDTYAVNGKPGAFRLERDGQRLHIIGALAKNKDGVLTSHGSVLETVITVPPEKRNGMKLLEDFCTAVSKSSRTPVVVGMVPMSMFMRYETEAGAKDQKARTFLVNELDRMTRKARLSWQLFYDAQMKTYFLNIHAV